MNTTLPARPRPAGRARDRARRSRSCGCRRCRSPSARSRAPRRRSSGSGRRRCWWAAPYFARGRPAPARPQPGPPTPQLRRLSATSCREACVRPRPDVNHPARIVAVADVITPAPFDHWPRYQELTELLETWAAERPRLLEVVAIGRSHEGRDIWLCEITDRSTGPPTRSRRSGSTPTSTPPRSPAAPPRCTSCTGCCHRPRPGRRGSPARSTRRTLLRRAAAEPRRRRAGAGRRAAATSAPACGPWPLPDPQPGLTSSRRRRRRPHPQHARARPERALEAASERPAAAGAARRRRGRATARYYRLLPEGHLVDYDGVHIKLAPELPGLDLNRNFPLGLAAGGRPGRAPAPFPTSEPEIRAARARRWSTAPTSACAVTLPHVQRA